MSDRKCSICGDKKGKITKQYCLDNEKHPTYKERYDCWDDLTYFDCWNFIRSNKMDDKSKGITSIQNSDISSEPSE